MSIFSAALIGVILLTSTWISLFISIWVFVFYIFYSYSKFQPLRAKATASFPKTQILTNEMIEAEMIRKSPEYSKFISNQFLTVVKIFGITFLISTVIGIVLAMLGINTISSFNFNDIF